MRSSNLLPFLFDSLEFSSTQEPQPGTANNDMTTTSTTASASTTSAATTPATTANMTTTDGSKPLTVTAVVSTVPLLCSLFLVKLY